MTDLLTASPSVGSWRHSPMTIAEIDAHPDADRIWSTIAAMQEGVKKLREDLKDAADEIRDFADRIESDAGQIASAMEKLK